MKKRYHIKNRFRFFISLSVLMTILFAVLFTSVVSAKSSSDVTMISRYVEEGDTLWKLSREYVDDQMDIRDYIITVMELNHLQSANIKTGDLLYFPQYE